MPETVHSVLKPNSLEYQLPRDTDYPNPPVLRLRTGTYIIL